MEREHHRYLVLKYRDIAKYLTDEEQITLIELANKIDRGRKAEGKQGPIECVVIESDWPEYFDVWSLLASRVDGVSLREARIQQFKAYVLPDRKGELT